MDLTSGGPVSDPMNSEHSGVTQSEAKKVATPIQQALTDARNFGALVSLPAGLAVGVVFSPQAGATVIRTAAAAAQFSPLTPLALLARRLGGQIGERSAVLAHAPECV